MPRPARTRYEIGERVLVNSALAFAIVVEIEETSSGRRHTVEFPEGDRLTRYWTELT